MNKWPAAHIKNQLLPLNFHQISSLLNIKTKAMKTPTVAAPEQLASDEQRVANLAEELILSMSTDNNLPILKQHLGIAEDEANEELFKERLKMLKYCLAECIDKGGACPISQEKLINIQPSDIVVIFNNKDSARGDGGVGFQLPHISMYRSEEFIMYLRDSSHLVGDGKTVQMPLRTNLEFCEPNCFTAGSYISPKKLKNFITQEKFDEILASTRDFSGCDISLYCHPSADFRTTYLNAASLKFADLSGANLSGANLMGADLSKSNFTEANLLFADLRDAVAIGTTFVRANLTATRLRNSYLIEANLTEANLEGVHAKGIKLFAATLTGANLSDGFFKCADMRKANLTEANLSRTKLNGANLAKANLRDANLTAVNLRGANLTGVNLEGANLAGTLHHILWNTENIETLFRLCKKEQIEVMLTSTNSYNKTAIEQASAYIDFMPFLNTPEQKIRDLDASIALLTNKAIELGIDESRLRGQSLQGDGAASGSVSSVGGSAYRDTLDPDLQEWFKFFDEQGSKSEGSEPRAEGGASGEKEGGAGTKRKFSEISNEGASLTRSLHREGSSQHSSSSSNAGSDLRGSSPSDISQAISASRLQQEKSRGSSPS